MFQSHDFTKIKTFKSRIKALENENKQLKDQVEKLHGKLF